MNLERAIHGIMAGIWFCLFASLLAGTVTSAVLSVLVLGLEMAG